MSSVCRRAKTSDLTPFAARQIDATFGLYTVGMVSYLDTRALRQARCNERATRARSFAWLLMPVTGATFLAALWSDPVLQPRLQNGLEGLAPLAMSLVSRDGAAEDSFAFQHQPATQATDLNATLTGLPVARTPINRPDQDS